MREGQVYFRAGEVFVCRCTSWRSDHEENIAQVNWLLQKL